LEVELGTGIPYAAGSRLCLQEPPPELLLLELELPLDPLPPES
jgi:hypothetical protein